MRLDLQGLLGDLPQPVQNRKGLSVFPKTDSGFDPIGTSEENSLQSAIIRVHSLNVKLGLLLKGPNMSNPEVAKTTKCYRR